MIKEAWDALRAAVLLDSELKRQREDIMRALTIIRRLAAENADLRARLATLENSHTRAESSLRDELLVSLHRGPVRPDFTRHY
ncbi:MAG: hypothetical protein ACKV2V_17415 [Blastocatellia bacterium]